MKLLLELKMNNDAFSDMPGAEVARILRKLETTLDGYDPISVIQLSKNPDNGWTLRDINGNNVGYAEVQP